MRRTLATIGALAVAVVVASCGTDGPAPEPTSTSSSTTAPESMKVETKTPTPSAEPEPEPEPQPEFPSREHEAAVAAALDYLDLMAFSKLGLLDQLTSEYGEQYPTDVASWAITYVEDRNLVDWDAEAVEAAENYLAIMPFSRAGLLDQLTSMYGDRFTEAQAEHAVALVYDGADEA